MLRTRKTMLAALAAGAFGVGLAPALAQDTKDAGLGWKLAKGDKAKYAYSYDVERNTEIMGMQIAQTSKLSLHLSEEVTDAAGGVATITATIDRIAIDADLGPMG